MTEEKEIDGVVKVLESWKGDLKIGQIITIPELEEFKAENGRMVHQWPTQKSSEYVSGARMILFLRDATKIPTDSDQDAFLNTDAESTHERWKAANSFGREIRYSTVWIEKGKAYCFVQVMNPGPSVLVGCRNEAQLKTEVSRVISVQDGLHAALSIADLETRAQSLEPFAQDKFFLARDQALKRLIDCGEAALPVLRRMLNNESLIRFHDKMIEAFAKAGRKKSGRVAE